MNTIYVTVAGRVATKPERLASGSGVGAKFRVASTERWFDRTKDAWNDAEPVYLTVTCWRQLAANTLLSLRIGDPVLVHGKLVNSRFERDGRPEYRLEMRADAVGPDLRWSTAAVTRTRAAAADAPSGGGPDGAEGTGAGTPQVVVPAPARGEHGADPDDGPRLGALVGEGAVRA
jgi:single-strand DNA-binding protein